MCGSALATASAGNQLALLAMKPRHVRPSFRTSASAVKCSPSANTSASLKVISRRSDPPGWNTTRIALSS